MAILVLENPEIDESDLGAHVESILRTKGIPMSAEDIREALKEPVDGTYIAADVEEIRKPLTGWLIPDGDVTEVDDNLYQSRAPHLVYLV